MGSAKDRRRALRRQHHVRPEPGTPPGTIVVDPSAPKPDIRVFSYDATHIDEHHPEAVAEVPETRPGRVLWVDVEGLGDEETIRALAERYDLHPLAVADVVHVGQRPKAEDYGKVLYMVLRQPHRHGGIEQVSLFLLDGTLLTFQERLGDPFDHIRRRLRENRGRVRRMGADYLAYTLVDAVVDHLVPLVEDAQNRVDDLEDEILAGRPHADFMARLGDVRREIRRLRSMILPTRDLTRSLSSGRFPHMKPETLTFLRDAHDHATQAADELDDLADQVGSLVSSHAALVNQTTNVATRLLTIIATVFIPLSFIAGVYGMNFDPKASPWNMPELGWAYGYPFALGVMGVIAGVLVFWFWRRGWLQRDT